MGLKNSKNKRNSYDIAAVVSTKDFTYAKHERPLPKVELAVKQDINEGETTTTNAMPEIKPNNMEVVEELKEVRDPRIPDWVNEINFKNMLLKIYPNIKEVIGFRAFPALAAGENYATLMLRIKLAAQFQDDTTQDFSFMLKVPHDSKEMQQMLQVLNFFAIENAMYKEVIPELEEMYSQAGVQVKLGAKSYRLELEDDNLYYVLLEDLGVQAFKNANRLECLNMEHTLCVLRKMAQFHAATACRAAKKGSYPVIFSPDMDNEMARAAMNHMFMSFKQPVLDSLKTYENGDKYYALMDHFFDDLVEIYVRSRKLLPGYFCVLCHGDSWCNNILFKYTDDGHVDETIFVDFQNCNWNSPAVDLHYFIFSSVQIDIKLAQFDYFVRYYHEHLSENLRLLEYPLEIPSLKEFHIQMFDFGIMSTMTSFLTMGIVLLEPTDNANFENFLSGTEEAYKFKSSMYTNERYRKYMKEILPWLYNRGFMEMNLREVDKKIAVADKLKELKCQQITKQTENIEHSSSFYPEWLNESLFFDVVETDCKNLHKVLKFAVSPAESSTQNNSSTLWQVDIDIELKDHTNHVLSYLLKTSPHGDHTDEATSMLHATEREIMAYFDIIPQLENVYKEQAGVEVVFAPKSFKLKQDGGNAIALVLENVGMKNFKNCDSVEGLDMKHVEAVLKKLAQFHAASAHLFGTTDTVPEIYKQKEIGEARKDLVESCTKIYLECLKQDEGSSEYFSKVKNCTDNLLRFLAKASCIDNNKFNVLNHGSCWTKNILFQHDSEENISATFFVDFQSTQYATPCYDLFQFLLTSPKLELKLQYFDYFVRYYHENLRSNLELLKYKKIIPSLEDFHQDLLANGVWAFYTVLCILPIISIDLKDISHLEKAETGSVYEKQMFLNQFYRSHTESILPWLDGKGLLDFNEKLC